MLCFLLFCLLPASVQAQMPLRKVSGEGSQTFGGDYGEEDRYSNSRNGGTTWGRDTTEANDFEVPIGVTQWTVDDRLGTIIPAESNDTVIHAFQLFNETYGYNGEYNILGNLGSPRLSRIYMHRHENNSNFLFLQPFDFLLGGVKDFRFSNTLSPLTNLAYHKVGNRTDGQERVRAYFASNINKVSGIGFKADYLYGRGYYNSQANSQFGGTLFGYYLGDRYNLHAYVNFQHLKMAENGGIEDDAYIRDPQSFPRKYGSKDIPTLLSDTWNRNKGQEAFLTHRFNLGFYRDIELPDSLRPVMPGDKELLSALRDSLQKVLEADTLQRTLVLDSLRNKWVSEQIMPQEFVPVSSIIHTLRINNLHHTYYAHRTPETYYTNHYYGELNAVRDRTKALSIENIVGLAMREGFQKWAQMGITAYLSHKIEKHTLPWIAEGTVETKQYTENDLAVGGEISRKQGKFVHYNVNGSFNFAGDNVGDFAVDGTAELELKLGKRDTLLIEVHSFVQDIEPNFIFRHYHSQFAWWDNTNLSKEFKTRIEGTLRLKHIGTRLTVGLENIKNYTYFAMQNTLTGGDAASVLPADYSHSVVVRQQSSNIQVFMARLRQDLKFGPFHWDSDITYQTSSSSALPLPKLSLYTNLYLQFRIAKVLNVELGGDMRYFTRYYAPDYSPAIQQFAVQDAAQPRVSLGNYPIINVYANLHLKHCRLYVAMNHVNAGTGRMFWAPHYPMDPMNLHFGLSWNFFN